MYYIFALFSYFEIMAYMNTEIVPGYPIYGNEWNAWVAQTHRNIWVHSQALRQWNIPRIEMHCHSTRSDGKNSPLEVVKTAKQRELDFITLTDHDVISPQDFQMNCEAAWIGTCDSVEISARNYEHEKSLHLVSYARIFSQSLKEILDASLIGKREMKRGKLQKIVDMWFTWNQQDFDRFVAQKLWRDPMTANKYDMARYLLSLPENILRAKQVLWELCSSNDIVLHFYNECLKRWGDLYEVFWHEIEDYEPSVEKVVQEVREKSWWLVSLAHPNFTFEKWWIHEFHRVLPDYVKKWVQAVEINARATPEWILAIYEARRKYDLILTFGTDCHEIGQTDRKHGDLGQLNPYIPSDVIEENFWEFEKKLWI